MSYKLQFHHWGCEYCKKKFPKGKVPKHTLFGLEFPSMREVTWTCKGSDKPTVGWYQRKYPSGFLAGMVRKKPQQKVTK